MKGSTVDGERLPARTAGTVQDKMEQFGVPGLSIGILRDGKTCRAGFGVVDLETHELVNPETLFLVGSISKVFVATLAVRLVDEGLVSLDVPIRTFLPDLRLADPTAPHRITLRHLLTHTSGLSGDGFADHGQGDDALSEYIATFSALRQETQPGEFWSYCNTGFVLAAAVVERVLGTTFEAAMRQRVIEPLGLDRTFFANESIPYLVATGYDHEVGREPKPVPRANTWRTVNPAGGMVSTVGDLLRFAEFHMGDGTLNGTRVLSEASVREMQRRQVTINPGEQWGIGWAMREINGVRIIEHSGWMSGSRAQLIVVPEHGAAVAILATGGGAHSANHAIAKAILSDHFGLPNLPLVRVSMPDETLARYTGRYRHTHMDITVTVENGGLSAALATQWHDAATPRPPLALVPVGEGEFVVSGGEFVDERVSFIPGEDGRPPFIRILGRLAALAVDDLGERPEVFGQSGSRNR